jgi:hypothetical protein
MVYGILALNAATYKPMSTVRFVLLDDAVLVARKSRRHNASESDKLVADRCWPLNEMLVLDTKDTPSLYSQHTPHTGSFLLLPFTPALVNVFKVKHGKETHVYRTARLWTRRICLQRSSWFFVLDTLIFSPRSLRSMVSLPQGKSLLFWIG